jgi:hypothetical protein
MIPVYSADGERRNRDCSLETALFMESIHAYVLQRHRRTGDVQCAQLNGIEVDRKEFSHLSLQNRLKAGTRYSHIERFGDRRAWTLEKLPIYPVTEAITAKEFYDELAERQVEPFLAVMLSCIENNSGE